jgi:predicted phosphodiesterase
MTFAMVSLGAAVLVSCSGAEDNASGSSSSGQGGSGQSAANNSAASSTGTSGTSASSGGTGGAATTGSGATSGSGGANAEVKVAFIGDSGNGSNFQSVLDLALSEQADAIIHNGDFDYGLDADGFFAAVDGKVGASYPYFASVGNHDAPAWNQYTPYLTAHMTAAGVTPDDPDLSDQMHSFRWRGLHVVFVGENGNNDAFAQYIDDQFQPNETEWKICGWHKNQRNMQIGGKGDEMGWAVYENCLAEGAIITTGHEHSYERTKTLTSMMNQTVDAACSDPAQICLAPGHSFTVVSGLGGVGIRDQERCLPDTPPYGCNGEWASIYASNQAATYGAFFIVFNVGGDTTKAHAYFKAINGTIVDEFDITRTP